MAKRKDKEAPARELGDEFRINPNLNEVFDEAAAALARSELMRKALGDAVVDHYVHTAKWEQFEYDRRITDWELKRYFEII